MPVANKLLLAILFLILVCLTLSRPVLLAGFSNDIFSLDLKTLLNMLINYGLAVGLIAISSLLFTLFVSLTQKWIWVLPVSLLASLLALVKFTPTPTLVLTQEHIVLSAGLFISFVFVTLLLNNKLNTYITFQPTALLSPSVKTLMGLIVIIFSIVFFLNAQRDLEKNGFQIPDSLIDTSISLVGSSLPVQEDPCKAVKSEMDKQNITIEQIDTLIKNPKTAQKMGITTSQLELLKTCANGGTLATSNQGLTNEIKNQVKSMVDSQIKPLLPWIPPLLALLFYSSLALFTFIFSLFVSPVVWVIFKIMEKTGFIKYQTEMREVKKMVV